MFRTNFTYYLLFKRGKKLDLKMSALSDYNCGPVGWGLIHNPPECGGKNFDEPNDDR